ncbi:hypothetical protein [Enterobacter ludwigii]|uniref:hypothetical protein n=1 Tax=Enterobacter ludwigii TaxID=299767 RepID=UPI0028929AF3|nr:hypothetical protein [Enterobacter ludwigii]WNI83829.1 hypothetical protein RIK68_24570 [Enterobacter ludwigii]
MATQLKKTRVHELDSFTGDPQGGVLLFSKENKEYKINAEQLLPTNAVTTVDGADGTATINPNNVTDVVLVLNDPATTLTISPLTEAKENVRVEFYLTVKQGTGANKITWPDNVKWPHNATPVLSYTANAEDTLALYTLDGGTTWKGSLIAAGY